MSVSLDNIKKLTNSSDESLLELLIDQCETIATDYCNFDSYDACLDAVVSTMVCEKYNRLYSEGINSKSYSGISESYTDDFSPLVYKALRKHRKLRTVTSAE